MRRWRWWDASLIALAVAIGLYLFAPTEADPDLWGHVRFGLDLLDTGRIVRPDIYSYLTAGSPWINHEWLSEAIMAIAFRGAGSPGLILVKLALGLGLAALLVIHLHRAAAAAGPRLSLLASLLITAYGVAVILPGFRSLRPQAFTYFAFLIILLLLYGADRGQQRRLWWSAPLFAAWANLHGGFVAGLGVLWLWAILRQRGLLPAIAATAATLVTPYGIGLWTFLARTLGPRPDIAEWQAVPLFSAEGVAYLAVVGFGAIAVPALYRSRQWPALILFVGGALLPFVARRHLPLFVLITIVMCAEHTAARWPKTDGSRFPPVISAAMLVQAIVLLALTLPQFARIRVDPAAFPIAATARLAGSQVAANVAVDFDWGEYVIWHAGPRLKVSVDGRRETVYSDAAYEQNRRFTAGSEGWDQLLDQQPTDLALVSVRTGAFDRLTQHAGWELLMHDEISALFGRTGAPVTRAIRGTPPPTLDPRRAAVFP